MDLMTDFAVVGQSRIYLKQERTAFMLDTEPQTLMAGGCALPTALHAVERAEVKLGDTVLVLGSGPVGLNTIILALMGGALRVLCIGAPEHRLNAAFEIGPAPCSTWEPGDGRTKWVRRLPNGREHDVTIVEPPGTR